MICENSIILYRKKLYACQVQFPYIHPYISYSPGSFIFLQFDFNWYVGLKTLFDLEWPILKCLHSGN